MHMYIVYTYIFSIKNSYTIHVNTYRINSRYFYLLSSFIHNIQTNIQTCLDVHILCSNMCTVHKTTEGDNMLFICTYICPYSLFSMTITNATMRRSDRTEVFND